MLLALEDLRQGQVKPRRGPGPGPQGGAETNAGVLVAAVQRHDEGLLPAGFVGGIDMRALKKNPVLDRHGCQFSLESISLITDLQRRYDFNVWEMAQFADADAWYQSSILAKGGRIRDWINLLARTLRSALINPSRDLTREYLLPGEPVTQQPIKFPAEITSELPGYGTLPNSRWDLLLTGQRMAQEAGVPLLLVNEPIYIASGPHSDVNYNSDYERAVYDRFRNALTTFTQDHQLRYLDLWNHLPPEEFSNTALHYNLQGNIHIAREIMQELQAFNGLH